MDVKMRWAAISNIVHLLKDVRYIKWDFVSGQAKAYAYFGEAHSYNILETIVFDARACKTEKQSFQKKYMK